MHQATAHAPALPCMGCLLAAHNSSQLLACSRPLVTDQQACRKPANACKKRLTVQGLVGGGLGQQVLGL